MKNICPKHALINTHALNTPDKGIHRQRRADGRPAFSDGTEYEDALVARFVSKPPFCSEKSALHWFKLKQSKEWTELFAALLYFIAFI